MFMSRQPFYAPSCAMERYCYPPFSFTVNLEVLLKRQHIFHKNYIKFIDNHDNMHYTITYMSLLD